MAKTNLEIIVDAKDNASGVLGRIGGALGSLGTIAASVAVTGLAAIAGGLAAVGTTGLSFNAQIEQVTARLNAFTKDGAETAKILGLIKEEASKTPFEFQEMADAAANLMSSAKQTNIPLMDLVRTAEILAASNPAQGLEGAAFSLKEALSGDFVSIVERFNLPRQRLKELKEQGVPAMEAIGIAMREMGLDSSLVANMAETAAGRWSTLKDNFTNMAGVVTQPIFDTFSAGLGSLNAWFSSNEGLVMSYAENVAGGIQSIIDVIAPLSEGNTLLALQNFQHLLMNMGFDPEQIVRITESLTSIKESAGGIGESFGKIFSTNTEGGGAIVTILEGIAFAMEKIAAAGDVAAQIRAIVEATGGIGAATNAIIEEGTGMDLARAGEMRPVAGQFGGTNMDFARAGEMQPTPGQFGGSFDFGPLITAITSAITGAPPPVVTVNANLDGAQIANSVSVRLGSDSQGLGRIGGHGTLNR